MSMTFFSLTPPLHSGGRETAGPSEKDMVCGTCYRFFVVVESSWKSAEARHCPYCHSLDTTPMLGEYYFATPVLVPDGKGGYR
jgi:hypothetical protein